MITFSEQYMEVPILDREVALYGWICSAMVLKEMYRSVDTMGGESDIVATAKMLGSIVVGFIHY